jgi:DNA repair protein RadD
MSTTTGVSAGDRDIAIGILNRRLTHVALRSILNVVQNRGQRRGGKSVEWMVVEAEQPADAAGRLRTKLPNDEVAALLVDLCGPDLLSISELRFHLALECPPDELDTLHEYQSSSRGRGGTRSQAEAIAARRWRPGGSWPSHFVRTLGFPPVFAGLPGDPKEPDFVIVEPFIPLPPLQDFQSELMHKALKVVAAKAGENRAILTLPTGAGKTRTAVETLLQWRLEGDQQRGILWIAQSEELCEQAVQSFREVWIDQGHRSSARRNSMTVTRLWGGRRTIPAVPDVIVASIQQLYSIVTAKEADGEDALECRTALGLIAQQLGVVIVDEAHRMLASSYVEVLTFIGVDPVRTSPLPLLGLTATPYRSDDGETRRLVKRFHGNLLAPENLGPDPIGSLRSRGVLSQPVHKIVTVDGPELSIDDDPKFKEHFEQFNDFHPELLKQLGQDKARNKRLLEILRELPRDWPTLFFACSLEHARAIAVLLRRQNRAAAVVAGETRSATRRFLIEEFRSGKISVLCNYGVLTTGFDAPKVRALVIARPTASVVLYEQMIGRGMRGRVFGGTDECFVVDVADNIRFGGQLAFNRYSDHWGRIR